MPFGEFSLGWLLETRAAEAALRACGIMAFCNTTKLQAAWSSYCSLVLQEFLYVARINLQTITLVCCVSRCEKAPDTPIHD